jgi:hypothetical protein
MQKESSIENRGISKSDMVKHLPWIRCMGKMLRSRDFPRQALPVMEVAATGQEFVASLVPACNAMKRIIAAREIR